MQHLHTRKNSFKWIPIQSFCTNFSRNKSSKQSLRTSPWKTSLASCTCRQPAQNCDYSILKQRSDDPCPHSRYMLRFVAFILLQRWPAGRSELFYSTCYFLRFLNYLAQARFLIVFAWMLSKWYFFAAIIGICIIRNTNGFSFSK